jgi:hypothetical protein
MNARDLLDAYQRVTDFQRVAGSQRRLPDMSPGSVDIRSERLQDPDAVLDALRGFAPVQGWITYQSHESAFFDGLPEPEPDWGLPLAGECVDAAGVSLHLRQDGAGGWRLTRYTHRPEGEGLCDTVEHLASLYPMARSSRYRRYWQVDAEHGVETRAACFIGFVKD